MSYDLDTMPLDEEGLATLEAISNAHRFNNWMAKTISRHLSGHTLEIGSGIGNISQQFLNEGFTMCLSDYSAVYCDKLKDKFADEKKVKDIIHLDIVDPDFDKKYADHFEKYDSAFALNVVEHVEDHVKAIENIKKFLKPGGKLSILVPAYQFLYCRFDKELGHFRRYTKPTLKEIFKANDLAIKKTFYFNFMGIFGWLVSGKIGNQKLISPTQMRIYNKLVPIFKIIDKLMMGKMGLSVICIAEKK